MEVLKYLTMEETCGVGGDQVDLGIELEDGLIQG
jgi:hypothetical protein